ncbi:MAG: hypothetical protein ACKVOX_17710 [Rhizobacter sp.]
MNTEPLDPSRLATGSIPEANAYLIVHADSGDGQQRDSRSDKSGLRRLSALYRGHAGIRRRAPLALTLADRQGQELLSLADADPTLGVALPPGTYHLTATLGDMRRGYTVSLPAGVRFDLHLHFPQPASGRTQTGINAADFRPHRAAP